MKKSTAIFICIMSAILSSTTTFAGDTIVQTRYTDDTAPMVDMTTGTGSVAGNCLKNGNAIRIIKNAGQTQFIGLYFSEAVLNGHLSVHLYNVTGRLTGTLFTGRTASSYLTIPLSAATIKSGIYLIKVLLDNKTIYQKNVSVTM
jgi:hypothetical protein